MTSVSFVSKVWDYGWLAGDELHVPPGASDRHLLEHYIGSPAFHTSFIPSRKDETGIHGPFFADRIGTSDFVQFEEGELDGYLRDLLFSSEWDTPASAEQFGAILEQLRKPFGEGMQGYRLRFDESNTDKHHVWGFVLTVFREFLFLDEQRGIIRRFLIGYD
jgi:hypothetical protein